MSAVPARLADGRLHLQHGPIDLIVSLDGEPRAVAAAERRAVAAFGPVLEALVAELPVLRLPAGSDVRGPVARRMVAAVRPWAGTFVTPMAAVAGAVADHVLAALLGDGAACADRGLRRASVNDGGDIALWLGPGERYRARICVDPRAAVRAAGGEPGRARGATSGGATEIEVRADDGIGGIATSGRGGRSRSLGIADAVTVLARDAAAADVAATLIANAVDLPGSPRVVRVRANELDADTDLGERLVTVDVGALSPAERGAALDAALPVAEAAVARGLIRGAFLSLQGAVRAVDGRGGEGRFIAPR